MLNLQHHLVLPHLRILEQRLVVVADDRDASALLDHRLEVGRAVPAGVGLEGLDQRLPVEGAVEGRRPARIGRHLLRDAEALAEYRPSALVPDEAEVDRQIAGAQLVLGRVRGCGEVPAPRERVVALRRVELRLDREQRAEFGDLDLLAVPAARAVDDRGHHALRREDPGGHRRGVRAEAQRRLVEGAEVAPDVAHRLQHDLAARLVAERPAFAERCDVAVDQLGVGRRQVLVTQPQSLRLGRGEVGHEHVGARNQALEGGPPGGFKPRGPGAVGNARILTDTLGVDFDPYLRRVVMDIRQNWYAVMPEIARLGKRGEVTLIFEILRDGEVPKLYLVSTSGSEPLDRAALAGISASAPFPPLPTEFSGPFVRIRVTFLYNTFYEQ